MHFKIMLDGPKGSRELPADPDAAHAMLAEEAKARGWTRQQLPHPASTLLSWGSGSFLSAPQFACDWATGFAPPYTEAQADAIVSLLTQSLHLSAWARADESAAPPAPPAPNQYVTDATGAVIPRAALDEMVPGMRLRPIGDIIQSLQSGTRIAAPESVTLTMEEVRAIVALFDRLFDERGNLLGAQKQGELAVSMSLENVFGWSPSDADEALTRAAAKLLDAIGRPVPEQMTQMVRG